MVFCNMEMTRGGNVIPCLLFVILVVAYRTAGVLALSFSEAADRGGMFGLCKSGRDCDNLLIEGKSLSSWSMGVEPEEPLDPWLDRESFFERFLL